LDPKAEQKVVKALALRIKTLRQNKGWSQERLAEEAEMHRTYLGGIERGLRNPALRNLIKISQALGVSMAELFQDSKLGR
jgi:transcriptional regulator with XRE-family HTH domain